MNTGVTVNWAVTGFIALFTAVKGLMLPVPEAPIPMVAMLFVQLYDVPVPVNAIWAVVAPLHKVWLAGILAVGKGFTVIVKFELDPVQVTPLLRY